MLATKFQMNLTCLLSCGTVLVQTIGYAIPGWLNLDIDGGNGVRIAESYAVWYIIMCISGTDISAEKTCSTISYITLRRRLNQLRVIAQGSDLMNHTLLTTHSLKFTYTAITEWELQVTGGLMASIIATGLLFRLRKHNNTVLETSGPALGEPAGSNFAIVTALSITSCMLFAASTVTVGHVHNTLTRIMHMNRTSTWIPYGLVVAAIGSLMALCTSVSMAVIFCKRGYRNSDHVLPSEQCQEQDLPMLPVQRNVVTQSGYASPLPPPYYAYQPVTENIHYSTKPPDYQASPSENHV